MQKDKAAKVKWGLRAVFYNLPHEMFSGKSITSLNLRQNVKSR